MDDDVLALGGVPRGSPASVTSPCTASWLGSEALRPACALQHPHRVPGIHERPHDRRADEARCARDEDPHGSKFFQ